MKLGLTYAILALIAMIANITAQDFILRSYSGTFSFTLAMIIGTAVGLVVKYALDKRYIFSFQAKNLAHDGQTFLLYSGMGIITTFFFWGMEWSFYYCFGTKEMGLIGGMIGLILGYFSKYHLDKRFVFIKAF